MLKLSKQKVAEIVAEYPQIEGNPIACIMPMTTLTSPQLVELHKSKEFEDPFPEDENGQRHKPLCTTIRIEMETINEITGKRDVLLEDCFDVTIWPVGARTDNCGKIGERYSPKAILENLLNHTQYGKTFTLEAPSDQLLSEIKAVMDNPALQKQLANREKLVRSSMDKDTGVADIEAAAERAKSGQPTLVPDMPEVVGDAVAGESALKKPKVSRVAPPVPA